MVLSAILMISGCGESRESGQRSSRADSARLTPKISLSRADEEKAAAQRAERARLDSVRLATEKFDESVAEFITDMYAEVLKDYSPRHVRRYFTPEFAEMYYKAEEISARMVDEYGDSRYRFIDYDFWTGSKGTPSFTGVVVKSVEPGVGANGVSRAKVTVELNGDESVNIVLDLMETPQGWRVSDYDGIRSYIDKYVENPTN